MTFIAGFRLLKLYAPQVCRPFDAQNDGLQMGEAAAGVLLEARTTERSARFELLDGAIAHDPGHIAAGSSDGATAARVMAYWQAINPDAARLAGKNLALRPIRQPGEDDQEAA